MAVCTTKHAVKQQSLLFSWNDTLILIFHLIANWFFFLYLMLSHLWWSVTHGEKILPKETNACLVDAPGYRPRFVHTRHARSLSVEFEGEIYSVDLQEDDKLASEPRPISKRHYEPETSFDTDFDLESDDASEEMLADDTNAVGYPNSLKVTHKWEGNLLRFRFSVHFQLSFSFSVPSTVVFNNTNLWRKGFSFPEHPNNRVKPDCG